MAFIINSKKDKNSLACKRKYGGVYIGGEFLKDGTVLSKEQMKKMTETQKERYVSKK